MSLLKTVRRYISDYRINGHYNIVGDLIIRKSDIDKKSWFYKQVIDEICTEIKRYSFSDGKIVHHETFGGYQIVSYNGDRMGKVFLKDSEYYRGVYRESQDDFMGLWKTGILQVFGDRGLIPRTEISQYCLPEYPVILHHQKVHMSPSLMWTFSMIKDAAILMAVINRVLLCFGYKLHDGHLNNMTFHNGKPMFTDIGSIVEDRGQSVSFSKELVFSACYKMMFEMLGHTALGRTQVYDENNNAVWVRPRIYNDQMREYRALLKEYYTMLHRKGNRNTKKVAIQLFEYYDVRPEYVELLFLGFHVNETEEEKKRIIDNSILDYIGRLPGAKSVLLLSGCNESTIEEFCNSDYKISVAHYDEAISELLYKGAKKSKRKANVYLFNYMYASSNDAREALKSDVVVALDITHGTGTVQRFKTDSMMNSIRKLTSRYVVITYYPNAGHNEKYDCILNEDGTEDMQAFISVFKHFFDLKLLKEVDSLPDGGKGYLFIGELYAANTEKGI